jgi:hypothetical protein
MIIGQLKLNRRLGGGEGGFTLILKGKGKGHPQKREKGKTPTAKREKGKRPEPDLRLVPTRQWTPHGRTNKTKRFPGHGGKALAALTPPNLRLDIIS